ncbi:hypothetical protein [Levilactobacillus angrenensis]|uniref:DUF5776 domain-containing protein n=1 Tax=Levilactobacillus angrenensis TaxID=2486020 RepID=A0ABW1UCB3_9LACO|nr:hypothetical protein [Levilactobacillus angrenensis]
MINKRWLKFAVIIMITVTLLPLDVNAATVNVVDVKSPKSVNTLKITKRWFRPRANKYERQKVSPVSKNYRAVRVFPGKGIHYNFSRYAFLVDGKPVNKYIKKYNKIKYIGRYGEPQAVAIVGHYMYVQMSFRHHGNKRKGRIVKYNLATMDKLINRDGKHDKIVRALQKARKYIYPMSSKSKEKAKRGKLKRSAKKHLSKFNYKVYTAVTFGPKFYTGHGQSFSYNPHDKHLYNVAYSLTRDTGKRAHPFKFQKISLKKLKPVKTWKLNVRLRKTKKILWFFPITWTTAYLQIHDLTFDSKGNFYFTRAYSDRKLKKNAKKARLREYAKGYRPGSKYSKTRNSRGRGLVIYRGKFKRNRKTKKTSISITMVEHVSNAIGYQNQGLAYSGSVKRLFLVYDNAFMSIPISKLNHKMSAKSLNFTVLKNHRESEGMGIRSNGKGYLVLNRYAEATISKVKVK